MIKGIYLQERTGNQSSYYWNQWEVNVNQIADGYAEFKKDKYYDNKDEIKKNIEKNLSDYLDELIIFYIPRRSQFGGKRPRETQNISFTESDVKIIKKYYDDNDKIIVIYKK